MNKKFLFAGIFILIATIVGITGLLYFTKQHPALAAGNIINAASCNQADVQTAINQAADGDTVTVPAGSCVWTTPSSCSGSGCASVYVSKAIVLRGAGLSSTIIEDNTGTAWNHVLIWVDTLQNKNYQIAGFNFNNINGSNAAIEVRGDSKTWRIDHNKFSATSFKTAIEVNGYTYGVIDHNEFNNTRGALVLGGDSETVWKMPLGLGTPNAVYLEDNVFLCSVATCNGVDANVGGRYVFRYNALTNSHVEAHGSCMNDARGTFSYEIYNNTFTGVNTYRPFLLRSGTGVVFNNTINGTYASPSIHIDNERSCVGYGTTCNDGPAYHWNSNPCNGTNAYDGNDSGGSGHPCRDQIGRSTDLGVFTPQNLEPLMEWNNTYNSVTDNVDIILNPAMCSQMSSNLQSGRDYFNNTPRPDYTPYAYPHPLIAATTRKGDFNFDDRVNSLDFISFKNAFKSIFNSLFDLNNDNAIDVKDLGVLMSNWLP